jgi:chitin synthase
LIFILVIVTDLYFRKVEGEAKGDAHGAGTGTFNGSSVPMRRWEDWERSRLRKIKREDKRRRDMARAFPKGYQSTEYLRGDAQSQYDGSDTVSMASSDEDQWGGQIGTYNENSSQYPPPPPGVLLPQQEMISTVKTVSKDEMAVMLESGFDDRPSDSNPSLASLSSTTLFLDSGGAPVGTARYQLTDAPSSPRLDTHPSSPMSSTPLRAPRHNVSPSAQWSGGHPTDSGRGRYGPLGPLDPGGRV